MRLVTSTLLCSLFFGTSQAQGPMTVYCTGYGDPVSYKNAVDIKVVVLSPGNAADLRVDTVLPVLPPAGTVIRRAPLSVRRNGTGPFSYRFAIDWDSGFLEFTFSDPEATVFDGNGKYVPAKGAPPIAVLCVGNRFGGSGNSVRPRI